MRPSEKQAQYQEPKLQVLGSVGAITGGEDDGNAKGTGFCDTNTGYKTEGGSVRPDDGVVALPARE